MALLQEQSWLRGPARVAAAGAVVKLTKRKRMLTLTAAFAAPSLEDDVSHPFQGAVFTFTQPNGERIKVRGWGDQNSAVFETLDGFTVVRNPQTGFYEIAKRASDGVSLEPSGHRPGFALVSALGIPPGLRPSVAAAPTQFPETTLTGLTRWQQRSDQAKAVLRAVMNSNDGPEAAPPQRQTVGTFIGLCLPIQFPDVPSAITADEISDFCNKPGYNGFGNNGSVRDYYLANSIGKCDYSTLIAPMFTAANPRDHYTDPSQRFGIRAQELIHEALVHHVGAGFDFTRLTADQSSFVFAINVFYAGEVVNNWREGLWPHAHFLPDQVVLAPGKIAHDYQITALGNELQLGTYCHENGHMLCDFPDLYDTDGDSAGIGRYCLMSNGGQADPHNPIQIGAYLKFKAGWAGAITTLTGGLNATAEAAGNHFFLLRKDPAEYYIVENRNKLDRDAALPSSGLAIWHVDELGSNRNQQGQPNLHYECALIQADGRMDLEQNANQGDATDLFDKATTFSGNWWDKQSTGVSIGILGDPGPSVAFKVDDSPMS
jgi:M6 family metalloprotease-like protein